MLLNTKLVQSKTSKNIRTVSSDVDLYNNFHKTMIEGKHVYLDDRRYDELIYFADTNEISTLALITDYYDSIFFSSSELKEMRENDYFKQVVEEWGYQVVPELTAWEVLVEGKEANPQGFKVKNGLYNLEDWYSSGVALYYHRGIFVETVCQLTEVLYEYCKIVRETSKDKKIDVYPNAQIFGYYIFVEDTTNIFDFTDTSELKLIYDKLMKGEYLRDHPTEWIFEPEPIMRKVLEDSNCGEWSDDYDSATKLILIAIAFGNIYVDYIQHLLNKDGEKRETKFKITRK